MKKTILLPLLALAFLFVLPIPSAWAQDPGKSASHEGHFRHVVCFQFKEGTPENEISEIEKEFKALKDKIDTIIDFEWGTTDNVEPLNDGFTHCFLVTFKDKASLETYLPHPDHQAFVSLLKPKLEKVFVFDYEVKI